MEPMIAISEQQQSKVLSRAKIDTLFSNLPLILPLQTKFLADLEKEQQKGMQNVPDVFLSFAPYFKVGVLAYPSVCDWVCVLAFYPVIVHDPERNGVCV